VKNHPSGKLRWSFSWSGEEMTRSDLFCSLPFSRRKYVVECKSKPCYNAFSYRSKIFEFESERENLISYLKLGSIASLNYEDFKEELLDL